MPQWSPDRESGLRFPPSCQAPRLRGRSSRSVPIPLTSTATTNPKPRGAGQEICLLSPHTGEDQAVHSQRPVPLGLRAEWSPDGRRMLFCRAETGNNPVVWIMDSSGPAATPGN